MVGTHLSVIDTRVGQIETNLDRGMAVQYYCGQCNDNIVIILYCLVTPDILSYFIFKLNFAKCTTFFLIFTYYTK